MIDKKVLERFRKGKCGIFADAAEMLAKGAAESEAGDAQMKLDKFYTDDQQIDGYVPYVIIGVKLPPND